MRFKLFIVALLILSVGSIALFGFATMMGHGDFEHDGCLAALSGAMPCPESVNPFDYTAFHLDLLRTFTSSVKQSAVILLIVVSGLLAWLSLKFLLRSSDKILVYYRYYKERAKYLVIPFRLRLARWLALHEARDFYNFSMGVLVFSRLYP